jgi:hypothetical protein
MKGLVVKAFDHPKSGRTGNHGDIFPLFVSLQIIARQDV